MGRQRALSAATVVVKVSGRPTDLPNVIRAAERTAATVVSRAALGLSWIALAERGLPSASRCARRSRPRACTVLDGAEPAARVARRDVAGQVVMERLKARFDPARIFRPGVFVGGI